MDEPTAPQASPIATEPTPEFIAELTAAPDALANNILRKADAGAALVYAIYHHPRAVELLKAFDTYGFSKAYMKACDAFGVGGR